MSEVEVEVDISHREFTPPRFPDKSGRAGRKNRRNGRIFPLWDMQMRITQLSLIDKDIACSGPDKQWPAYLHLIANLI